MKKLILLNIYKLFLKLIFNMDQSASTQKSFLIRDLLRDLMVNKNTDNDESCDDSGNFYSINIIFGFSQ